ncbi:MAG TPA: hypothetical protein VFM82_02620 [Flavobacteriaceae bacterium]|nr:hypothetical protein [Flavobacteriaceae bacterium]
MKLFRGVPLLVLCLLVLGCQDNPSSKTLPAPVVVSNELSQKDKYKGMKEKILEHLTVKEIPADFPVYRDGETQKEYKIRTMLWAKENLDLVKPEYRKRVENFQKK